MNQSELLHVCGFTLNLSDVKGTSVHASQLFDCDDDFPDQFVDWDVYKLPAMRIYYPVLTVLGVIICISNLSIVVGVMRDTKLRRQVFLLQVVGQALTDLAVGILIVIFHGGTLAQKGQFLGGETGCTRMLSSGAFCNPIYNWAVLLPCGSFMMVPISFIVFTYYKVHKVMRKTMAAAQTAQNSRQDAASSTSTTPKRGGITFFSRSTRASSTGRNKDAVRRAAQQNRATRLMIMMCASILVLWTPLYIYFMFVLYHVFTDEMISVQSVAEICLGVSAAASSLCSPLIYGFCNRTMNQAMLFAFLPMSWKPRCKLFPKADSASKET
ncbi:Pyroglutamylated RFamide peptide receptor [Hondaea fermentalgiana]|uniref:Pyroglutamylated RFamide peptide receptor n=1 Tax=Hondaea fermentalgiana TaxID=2315210 RepID=A0A2R5GDP5_9STRA|nr:Pyroglutamylated RFamide peptide receptor [Hondaea fermentalgiana]|eukprot:GBG29050.1 Pyroglutamylated RFamide peptide receptor [Hondaea fermentalgiana]